MNREELMTAIYENTVAVRKGMAMHMHDAIGRHDISPAQLHLLFTIKHEQPVNAKQLAAKLRMTAGAVSQLVDGLVQRGIIERSADPADRRVYRLTVSPTGRKLLATIDTKRRETMDKVMAQLTTEELEAWLMVQHKLLEVFSDETERSLDGKHN